VVAGKQSEFRGRQRYSAWQQGWHGWNPLPGIAVKVVNPATMEPLPANSEGLLLVKGPNRMLGYLGQPERTRRSVAERLVHHGDIGALDDEGFHPRITRPLGAIQQNWR